MCGVIDETVAEFTVPAARRAITLIVDCAPDVTLTGDRAALRQVAENLLSNAIRYSGDGAEIRIGAGERDDWMWLAVADQGSGIDPDHHDLVWQRHWRAGGDDADRPRRGLGLAVVRQVAEAHGGLVQLTSSVGEGSTFVVWIPHKRGASNSPPAFQPFA